MSYVEMQREMMLALKERIQVLERRIEEAVTILRNDQYRSRVANALSVLEEDDDA